jgi:hypothetical protein
MSILVDAIIYSIEDSLRAFLVREEAHGSGLPSHLPKFPLQHVGSAYLFPQLLGEGVIVQAVIEVLLQTPHSPLSFLVVFISRKDTPLRRLGHDSEKPQKSNTKSLLSTARSSFEQRVITQASMLLHESPVYCP